MRLKQAQKVLLAISTVLLSVIATTSIIKPQVTGFEPSLYDTLPIWYWASLWGSLALSALILITSIETKEYTNHGVVVLFATLLLFLSLPSARGYFHYGLNRSDIFAHLGYTRTIINTGTITPDDFYPIMHILLATFEFIGVGYWQLASVLTLLTAPLLISGLYIFTRRLTGNSRIAILVLSLSSVPLYDKFYFTLQPAVVSFFLSSYFFWAIEEYRRTVSINAAIVTFVLIFAIIFMHPIGGFYIFISIGVYVLVALIGTRFSWIIDNSDNSTNKAHPRHYLPIAGISLVALLAWNTAFEPVRKLIAAQILFKLTGDDSILADQAGAAAQRGLTRDQIIARFFELYGPQFIFGLVISFILLYLAYTVYVGDSRLTEHEALATGHYLTGAAVAVTLIVIPFSIGNAIRLARYAILFMPILVAIGLIRIYGLSSMPVSKKRILTTSAILICVLGIALPLALMNVYQPNQHHTKSENTGAVWMVNHADHSERVYAIGINVRLQDAIEGRQESRNSRRLFNGKYAENRPDLFPPNLGYNDNDKIGDSFQDGYLITHDHGRRHTEVYYDSQIDAGTFTYYTKEDINRAHQDSSVNKIYTNDGWTVWSIRNGPS